MSGREPIARTSPPGEWPMWRHDPLLTGHQPLAGAMREAPVVRARHFLGAGPGVVTAADLDGGGIPDASLVVARSRLYALDRRGRPRWECNPAGYCLQQVAWVTDLDGDGRNEVIAVAGHLGGTRWALLVLEGASGAVRAAHPFTSGQFGYARFCGAYAPGRRGQQVLLVTSGNQDGQGGWTTHGRIALLGWSDGALHPLWEFEPEQYPIEYPAALIGDLGAGGRQAVVDSWCHVWNLDLNSGDLRSHTTWDPGGANARHYGWNQLCRIGGRPAFVNLSLTKHVDVLLADAQGRLELAWTRGWPDPVTTEARSLVCPGDPVADVDSDGSEEVVVAVYDGLADSRWHLYAFDAATGRLEAELLDRVPVATAGLGGGAVVLCTRNPTAARQPPEAYEVWRVRHGRWQCLWSDPQAGFALDGITSDESLSVGFNGLDPRRAVVADADGDGRPELFTRQDDRVQAWGLEEGRGLVARPGGIPATAPAPGEHPGPPLQGRVAGHLLAADLRGRGRSHLLACLGTEVLELRWEGQQLAPAAVLRSLELPVVCPLGEGLRPHLLTADRGPDRNLFVEARRFPPDPAAGLPTPRWRFVFPDSQGCGQYLQAVFLCVGRFTGRPDCDVFAYSTKPGARAYLLDGRTGQPLWEREELPGIERHFQAFGGRAAAWDGDGDGEDDLLFCCPDYYCVADGRTGRLHVGPVFLPDLTGYWSAYCSPAVLERPPEAPVVYLGGAYQSRASVRPDGTARLWSEFLPAERWPLSPGDHRFGEGLLPPAAGRGWRVVQAQVDGRLVCLDAVTGARAWELPLEAVPTAVVTADLDGDGRCEFLFGGHDGRLRAYRDAGERAEPVWECSFDGPVASLVVADLDGDGASEIAVSAGDGYLYVLGPAPSEGKA